MFDKLIESEPAGAEFHGRKRYFMVSSVVMGVLFTTAVVYSLYAAEVGLGTDNFSLTAMLAPVTEAVAPPDVEQPRPERATAPASDSPVPTRQINMSRVDEPTIVPTTTSVVANSQLSRPKGNFDLGKVDLGPVAHSGPGRSTGEPGTSSVATLTSEKPVETAIADPEPPPAKKPPAAPRTQSLGVINGRAAHLPKPVYSAAAIAVKAQGKVDVQVLIDETGKVVSARAISGHPLLKDAAVRAAQNAKFTPTLLSHVPVKVTGVIVYNFTR